MWFSETANVLLYEEYFHLTNIEKDFLQFLRNFTLMKNLEHVQKLEKLWRLTRDIFK